MKKLLLLAVLFCGCETSLEDLKESNTTNNIKYTDARKESGCYTYIMEYEGNKYIVVLTVNGAAVCPALPAKVEK